jgi:L-iditol 2-dehydrogenase
MRALVCERAGVAALRDIPVPVPGPGEIVVKVAVALTCGTDLKLLQRGHPKIPFPVTLGHEFAGTVHAAGDGAPFTAGERVTCAVSGPCGDCPECRAGRENLCATAFDAPVFGGFAEYVRVPARVVARGLRAFRERVSFEAAALLDPLASVLHGLARAPVQSDSTLLIVGAGPIALLFAILGREKGAKVLVAGRRPARLASFAAQAAEPIDLTCETLGPAVSARTEGRGADLVVDTTGDAGLVPELLPLVRRGGTLLLFAGMPGGAGVTLDAARLHYDEVSVVGSFHYTPADADRALELLTGGWIPVRALVTATRPLAEWAEAFAALRNGDGMKTALVP